MNSNIQTLSHEPLVWEDALPPGFTGLRLPGGNLLSASGELGTLCVQEYRTENYAIRYNVFDGLKHCVLKSDRVEIGLFTQLVLQGKVHQQINPATQWQLSKNQFTAVHAKAPEIISTYNAQKTYSSIDAFFSPQWVKELLPMVPAMHTTHQNITSGIAGLMFPSPRWADADALELVQSILHCSYEKQLLRYFFDSRVRELLYKLLTLLFQSDLFEKQPSSKELEAVEEAERIINSDISKHNFIPQLSRLVGINECRFKLVFKKVFGMGPYEYLVRQRMMNAKQLLQSGLSVKEVAAVTGYRPSDFTTAFIQHYGFPPSAVKRKNS